jgi:acetylornithine deacetylase/succinyl-diaminopimelate desuccinylase-like protein
VPEYCTITLDRHYVRGENEAGILSEFRRAVRNSGTRAKVFVSIERRETPYLRPYQTELRDPSVQKFFSTYTALFGKMPTMYCNESVGDYNIFGKRMPTLIYGPRGADWHAKGEYVEIDSIKRCHKMYVEFLKGFK